MEIVIISEQLFKAYSPIKEDTIITKFVPYLLMAQRMHILPLLGKPLLTELQTQVKDDDLTDENRALIEVLAPMLANYAVYQGIPFHWAAIVNKGVTIRNSENSAAVSVDDVGQLRRWLKDDCDNWARMAVEYLCGCASTYPLWTPAGRCGGGCGPAPQDFDAGIYIPRRRRGCC